MIEIILSNLHNNNISGRQVGVITPYRGQYELIREKCINMKYVGVRCSCVDIFQGTERDYVILSLVRTNEDGKFGFITDINVSLTRARKGLFIIGNFNAIVSSEEKYDHDKNSILIKLCRFYEGLDALVDSNEIRKIEAKRIRINFKGKHPLPLKKLVDEGFWKDYKDSKNTYNDDMTLEITDYDDPEFDDFKIDN